MAFSDPDPIEEDMGVLCEDMSPEQLVSYIKTYHGAYGRKIAIDGLPERAVFKGMKRIYGEKTAGLIVKWVFYKHKGSYRGEVVTPLKFAKGRKWWVDMMHQELQAEQRKAEAKTKPRKTVGSASLSDL